mgnify:CR=1 FL=1
MFEKEKNGKDERKKEEKSLLFLTQYLKERSDRSFELYKFIGNMYSSDEMWHFKKQTYWL